MIAIRCQKRRLDTLKPNQFCFGAFRARIQTQSLMHTTTDLLTYTLAPKLLLLKHTGALGIVIRNYS